MKPNITVRGDRQRLKSILPNLTSLPGHGSQPGGIEEVAVPREYGRLWYWTDAECIANGSYHGPIPTLSDTCLLAALAVCLVPAVAHAMDPYNVVGTSAYVVLMTGSTEMSASHTAQPISYTHTLRITFSYDSPKLEITSVRRVVMRVPAVVTPPPEENQAGYWLEVRDDKGALLYHRPIYDPMRRDTESFGDAPGDPMRRQPATSTKGEFEVLVPELPGAHTFHLHGPSTEARAASAFGPSTSLSEHSFDDLRRLGLRNVGQGGTP